MGYPVCSQGQHWCGGISYDSSVSGLCIWSKRRCSGCKKTDRGRCISGRENQLRPVCNRSCRNKKPLWRSKKRTWSRTDQRWIKFRFRSLCGTWNGSVLTGNRYRRFRPCTGSIKLSGRLQAVSRRLVDQRSGSGMRKPWLCHRVCKQPGRCRESQPCGARRGWRVLLVKGVQRATAKTSEKNLSGKRRCDILRTIWRYLQSKMGTGEKADRGYGDYRGIYRLHDVFKGSIHSLWRTLGGRALERSRWFRGEPPRKSISGNRNSFKVRR